MKQSLQYIQYGKRLMYPLSVDTFRFTISLTEFRRLPNGGVKFRLERSRGEKEFWGCTECHALDFSGIYSKICCLTTTQAAAERGASLYIVFMIAVSGSRCFCSVPAQSLAVPHIAARHTRKQQDINAQKYGDKSHYIIIR